MRKSRRHRRLSQTNQISAFKEFRHLVYVFRDVYQHIVDPVGWIHNECWTSNDSQLRRRVISSTSLVSVVAVMVVKVEKLSNHRKKNELLRLSYDAAQQKKWLAQKIFKAKQYDGECCGGQLINVKSLWLFDRLTWRQNGTSDRNRISFHHTFLKSCLIYL